MDEILRHRRLAFAAMVNADPSNFPPDFRFQIFISNADGSGLRRVDHLGGAQPPTTAGRPVWSDGGNKLEYTVHTYSEEPSRKGYWDTKFSVSLEDGALSQLTEPKNSMLGESNPELRSPDGKYAALYRFEDDEPGFFLSRTDGTEDKPSAEELDNVVPLLWAPDSSAILLETTAPGEFSSLWLFDVASGEIALMTNNLDAEPMIAWCPDGSAIVTTAVLQEPEFGIGFFLVSRDGRKRRHLVSHNEPYGTVNPSAPGWSSDGKFIAVSVLQESDVDNARLHIFDRQGQLVCAYSYPNANFMRIDDIVWEN